MQSRQSNFIKHGLNHLAYHLAIRPLWALGSTRQHALPILISGSPRSGSTWLLEVLERHFAARRNWEPIDGIEQHLGTAMGQRQFGLRPYIPADGANHPLSDSLGHPLAKDLLGIVDGDAPRQLRRAFNKKIGPLGTIRRMAASHQTVVKFTEAQRCLPFIAKQRANKAVVLLRNPLSVTASALTFGGVRCEEPPPGPVPEPRRLPEALLQDFPQLEKYAGRSMSRAQYIGLSTAIDMLIPMSDPACREKYLFASYETLKSGEAGFGPVINYLGDPSGLSRQETALLAEPSSRARPVSAMNNSQGDWEGRLLPGEKEAILEICADLGIHWYSDQPGIDHSRFPKADFHHLNI